MSNTMQNGLCFETICRKFPKLEGSFDRCSNIGKDPPVS